MPDLASVNDFTRYMPTIAQDDRLAEWISDASLLIHESLERERIVRGEIEGERISADEGSTILLLREWPVLPSSVVLRCDGEVIDSQVYEVSKSGVIKFACGHLWAPSLSLPWMNPRIVLTADYEAGHDPDAIPFKFRMATLAQVAEMAAQAAKLERMLKDAQEGRAGPVRKFKIDVNSHEEEYADREAADDDSAADSSKPPPIPLSPFAYRMLAGELRRDRA